MEAGLPTVSENSSNSPVLRTWPGMANPSMVMVAPPAANAEGIAGDGPAIVFVLVGVGDRRGGDGGNGIGARGKWAKKQH